MPSRLTAEAWDEIERGGTAAFGPLTLTRTGGSIHYRTVLNGHEVLLWAADTDPRFGLRINLPGTTPTSLLAWRFDVVALVAAALIGGEQ